MLNFNSSIFNFRSWIPPASVFRRWCDAAVWATCVLVSGLCLSLAGAASAQTVDGERAIESGRQALGSRGNYPWYDAQQDAVRRIDVRAPKEAAAHRNSTWEAKPPQSPPTTWSFRGFWEVLRLLAWTAILLLLVVLVVLLVRAFLNREAGQEQTPEAAETTAARSDPDLIENLPFQVPRLQSDLLAEARRLYELGRYSEAVIYLFSYQLVQLDKHQLVRLARGKTNRQYLREVASRPDLRDILARTMVSFEVVFFGHHTLDREPFEACWTRLDEFHLRMEEGTSA
jgi:Domain of unknown function (DUF4129)